MQRGDFGTPIRHGDADQNVVGRCFRVLGKNIEIAMAVENAGVGQFEFRLSPAAPPVFLNELRVGKFSLRILVERFHVGVSRR